MNYCWLRLSVLNAIVLMSSFDSIQASAFMDKHQDWAYLGAGLSLWMVPVVAHAFCGWSFSGCVKSQATRKTTETTHMGRTPVKRVPLPPGTILP